MEENNNFHTLSSLLDEINKELPEIPEYNQNKIPSSKKNEYDDIDTFDRHQNFLLTELQNEIEFKRKARIWSISILSAIGLIMLLNIFAMLYFQGSKFMKVIAVPEFESGIVLAMIGATFANLFAIITLIFKYIFSPTSELMTHAKEMNGN